MSGGIEDAYSLKKEYESIWKSPVPTGGGEHYKKVSPEPIVIIESWGLNYNLGNVIKYVARCNYKGQKKEDLKKAIWYLERELASIS